MRETARRGQTAYGIRRLPHQAFDEGLFQLGKAGLAAHRVAVDAVNRHVDCIKPCFRIDEAGPFADQLTITEHSETNLADRTPVRVGGLHIYCHTFHELLLRRGVGSGLISGLSRQRHMVGYRVGETQPVLVTIYRQIRPMNGLRPAAEANAGLIAKKLRRSRWRAPAADSSTVN